MHLLMYIESEMIQSNLSELVWNHLFFPQIRSKLGHDSLMLCVSFQALLAGSLLLLQFFMIYF